MKTKTKEIQIGDNSFQLRKLDPEAGSFILMRMIGALQSGVAASTGEANATPTGEVPSGEDMVRAVAFGAFFRGLDFEMYRFVQKHCLACVSVLKGDAPIPIVSDGGAWVATEVDSGDVAAIMRLTVEVLVFNFADFFDQGGFGSILDTPVNSSL